MNSALEGISEHMKSLGLGILSQAQQNVFFYHFVNRYDTTIFGVLQTAHAAEILIKACIAEVEPLLIFTNATKFTNSEGELIDPQGLFDNGRTIEYSKLQAKLEEVTGYKRDYHDLWYTSSLATKGGMPDAPLPGRTDESLSDLGSYQLDGR